MYLAADIQSIISELYWAIQFELEKREFTNKNGDEINTGVYWIGNFEIDFNL